jgi:hypothetical protein
MVMLGEKHLWVHNTATVYLISSRVTSCTLPINATIHILGLPVAATRLLLWLLLLQLHTATM